MLSLDKALVEFLVKHHHPGKPVLLALSGGPDSLLMFHLLVQIQKRHPLQFGIAHVDHGWREESAREAALLAGLAARHGLPFYLKTLNPREMKGNLEAACREERLHFFAALCHEHDYQAVLLGHHAGDFIETVFKRMLEGSSLIHLAGMAEITQLQGITYWRPWLKFPKSDILNAIKQYHLTPFEDATNKDPKFIRARFRTKILPWLSREFGKQIESSIEHLGREAGELKDYLDSTLGNEIGHIQRSPFGYHLDTGALQVQHPFALKYMLKKICERGDFALSRDFVEKTVFLLQTQAANKEIRMGAHRLYIDRRHLFLVQQLPWVPEYPLPLVLGESVFGSWKVKVEPVTDCACINPSSWIDGWKGRGEVYLPEGNYQLRSIQLTAHYPRNSSMSHWFSNAKVPAFLRTFFPVVMSGDEVCAEFLTGRPNVKFKAAPPKIKIQLDVLRPF